MPSRIVRSACFLVALALCCHSARSAEPFSLSDGDRVVLLGSTFIERAQTHGYLEAALASRFHGANLEFRNLGWSGDNVFGEARAGFGDVAHGFEQLQKHVAEIQPTVILLAYGANESFAGKPGLDKFRAGLDALLAALDKTGAQIVFVGPPPHEDLGRPLPDPKAHNEDLKLYSQAIADVAKRRGDRFVDLLKLEAGKLSPPSDVPLTDNGIHLTAHGYWRAAPVIEQLLGLPQREWQVEIDTRDANMQARGTLLRDARFEDNTIAFRARDEQLPLPPAPENAPVGATLSSRVLRVFDLPPGEFALEIDGTSVATGNQLDWADGITITRGPEFDQAEKLRQTILEKNVLYFHRWRPQNVTYLFGFRKHEQGQNAVEIPRFDPLVAARDEAIHTLAIPAEHEYQLRKVDN